MITFKKDDKFILATYSTRSDNIDWLYEKFKNDEDYDFQKTFTFSKKDLVNEFTELELEDSQKINPFDGVNPLDFYFATLVKDYYQIKKGVITNKFDIYIDKEIEFKDELFVAEGNLSIFKSIENLIDEDVYIGGGNPYAISEEHYYGLLSQFPNPYEKKLYADAKITRLIKEFFSTTKESETKFQKYLNKKESPKGENLTKIFKDSELIKYETIFDKLTTMLADENNYSEHQWQKEILQIVLLLYPKYITVFMEVPVNADDIKQKFLDFLLVDANGNTDIIEIKKPFENSIVTARVYRDNHIPLKELSGTVMQVEKYVYYLNRWSIKGEKYLTEKYKDELPENFSIKITNPSGIIIMGREHNITREQKRDFEVVKRKYKNVIDIITYDNLIERLRFTIEQIKKI